MADILVAPPGILAVVQVLREGLNLHDKQGVHASVPAQRPSRFVTVADAGGTQPDRFTDSVALIVQAWDDDKQMGKFRTGHVARLCIGILRDAAGSRVPTQFGAVQVRGLSGVSSPAWFPDPDTSIARYQFTATLGFKITEHN